MEFLDDELICPICREIFNEPVTLLCGHNLCYGCVSELKKTPRSVKIGPGHGLVEQVASMNFTCPLCLAPCDVKMDLQKNIVLTNIIEKYHNVHDTAVYCCLCKEEKRSAEKSCVNCNGSFCTVHIKPHYRDATLRQHTLVNPLSDTSKLCKEHGKEFELFCETDSTPLCAYCMLPTEAKHNDGHSIVKLSETRVTLTATCEAKLARITESLSDVCSSMGKVHFDISKRRASLLRQKNENVAFLKRVKMFVEEEAKAWTKKFSLDMEKLAHYEEYSGSELMRLQHRLIEVQTPLLKSQKHQDPLTMLQLLKNTDWDDLFERRVSVCKIQWGKEKNHCFSIPEAFTRITPLMKSLKITFSGHGIRFHRPSAHPRLQFSPDNTSVWMRELEDKDFLNQPDCPFCVLSENAFTPGGHYWEVEVEGLTSWALGVARVINSSETVSLRQNLGSDQASWAVSYSRSRQQMSVQHHTVVYSFPANDVEPPCRVGVFLDVAGGILTFYDAVSHESIYTFYFRTGPQSDTDPALLAAFCPRLREDDQPPSTRPMKLLASFSEP